MKSAPPIYLVKLRLDCFSPRMQIQLISFSPVIMLNYSHHLSVWHEVLGTREVVTLNAFFPFYF